MSEFAKASVVAHARFRRRSIRALLAIAAVAILSPRTGAHGQDPAPPQTPLFKSSVEVVQVDVSVLDDNRRPVRGLTAADFTLLEEGEPREIQSFFEVDVPVPVAPPTDLETRFPPDVSTNQQKIARVVVVVIDDSTLERTDQWAVASVKKVGQNLVADLGPDDLAVIVYTTDNQRAQGLTSERKRLLTALETLPATPAKGDPSDPNDDFKRGWCRCGLCGFQTLSGVAQALRPLSNLNKTVVYVSHGLDIRPQIIRQGEMIPDISEINHCASDQQEARNDALRQAQLSNVRIHTIDPVGLVSFGGVAATSSETQSDSPKAELLKTLAETTGGRWLTLNNDPDRKIATILAQSRSYYLLGFSPSRRDGKEHRLTVQVNRRGVDVRARQSYFAEAPRRDETKRRDDKRNDSLGALEAATSGLLAKADLPLRAAAAPFADDRNAPVLAMVLNIEGAAGGVASADSRTAPINVLATTFDHGGKAIGSRRLTLSPPRSAGSVEALMRLPVKPGHYEIRLAAENADARTASVFVQADVPNFEKEPLAASGLVLSASPPVPTGPHDAFKDLMPILPTARRAFLPADRVVSFLRIYQAGKSRPVPAALEVKVVDASTGAAVMQVQSDLAAEAFAQHRRADCQFELPIGRLAAGDYVLTVDVKAGDATVQRALRFSRQ